MTLRIGSVCTGYGGLDSSVQAVLGGELAWVADPDPGATKILAHHHPQVPNLGDITETDWATVPAVDVLTAGFPCQDLSLAGRGAGLEGTRSGLFFTIVEAVRVVRPRLLVLENVAALAVRGLDRVAAELAAVGYVGSWRCVRASDAGAPHRRERIFIAAWPADADAADHRLARPGIARPRRDGSANGGAPAADADGSGSIPQSDGAAEDPEADHGHDGLHPPGRLLAWGAYEPAIARWERVTGRRSPVPTELGRNGNPRLSPAFVEWLMGLPAGHVTDPAIGLTRTQQLHALGNGVVPQQGAHALRLLLERACAVEAA